MNPYVTYVTHRGHYLSYDGVDCITSNHEGLQLSLQANITHTHTHTHKQTNEKRIK